MTDTATPVTPAADEQPPLASIETLGAWAKEVQSQFMARYKEYLAAAPAPTRKAVLRIQLQTTDAGIREVLGAVNHAYRSTRMAAAIQAALDTGNPQALADLRDPTSGRPTPYAAPNIAAQHIRELELAVNQIRKATPARLEKAAGQLKDIDAVLADNAGTPEDAIARVAELEQEIAASNATWQARIIALEARFDQVATGAAAPPKPSQARKAAAKKPPAKPPVKVAAKKPTPKKPATPPA